MESCKESKSLRNFDPETINRLLLSMGHLKFSLRSLASEGVQGAVLATEDCENPSCEVPRESNKILEKAISEVTSADNDETVKGEKCAKFTNKTSIENLQMVRDKLRKELSSIRLYHQSILSEKLEKSR